MKSSILNKIIFGKNRTLSQSIIFLMETIASVYIGQIITVGKEWQSYILLAILCFAVLSSTYLWINHTKQSKISALRQKISNKYTQLSIKMLNLMIMGINEKKDQYFYLQSYLTDPEKAFLGIGTHKTKGEKINIDSIKTFEGTHKELTIEFIEVAFNITDSNNLGFSDEDRDLFRYINEISPKNKNR